MGVRSTVLPLFVLGRGGIEDVLCVRGGDWNRRLLSKLTLLGDETGGIDWA